MLTDLVYVLGVNSVVFIGLLCLQIWCMYGVNSVVFIGLLCLQIWCMYWVLTV